MIKKLRALWFALGVYILLLFAFFTWPFEDFWSRKIQKLIKWHDRT